VAESTCPATVSTEGAEAGASMKQEMSDGYERRWRHPLYE